MNELLNNRYLLKHKIGSGGMADVYFAFDTVLNREVAIKILRGDLSHDPVQILRFQREANAVSGLNHPNIVDVYDVGEEENSHYIVMELLKGTTLKQLISRRGALEEREAVGIMLQLAQGLKKAHDHSIVHRDIKPQNILIEDDGTVKLTDFGIALAGDALQLTKSDSVLGSVHYMAPECSRGEGASYQSDIYALGVVFYELLTGKVPFQGENAVDIAMKHLRDPFPSAQDVNPELPNSIENIIRRSTAKQKSIRYLNLDDFLQDLNSCLSPDKLKEPLVNLAYELEQKSEKIETKKPLTKKQKIMYGVGGSLALILVVTLVVLMTRPKAQKMTEVPDTLIGKSLSDITQILEESHLTIDQTLITYDYSKEYEKDLIIETMPKPGSVVPYGKAIKLVISSGKMLEIENYQGMKLIEVEKIFQDFNVRIRTESKADATVEPGMVLAQKELDPGTFISPNKRYEILLVISAPPSDIVPSDIIGMSVKDAEAKLTGMHFQVTKERLSLGGMSNSEIDALSFGTVVRTNPTAGSFYTQEPGKSIILFYYDENDKPKVPEEKPQTPGEGESNGTTNNG